MTSTPPFDRDFACPNCRAALSHAALSCATCGALFDAAGAWRPLPRGSLRKQVASMTAADYLLWPVKVLVSVVCIAFGVAVLFGDWHWGRPLAAAFFFALGGAAWVMLLPREVRRVMAGILAAGFGVLLLYAALVHGGMEAGLPQDCSSVRRRLGCYLLNALHAVGGVTLVRAFWAAVGFASVFAGVQLARGALPFPSGAAEQSPRRRLW